MLPDHLMRHVENVPVIIHPTKIKMPCDHTMMLIRGKEKPAMAAEVETGFWSMEDVIAPIDAPKLAIAICWSDKNECSRFGSNQYRSGMTCYNSR